MNYLDGWLIFAQSREMCAQMVSVTVKKTEQHSLIVNTEKSKQTDPRHFMARPQLEPKRPNDVPPVILGKDIDRALQIFSRKINLRKEKVGEDHRFPEFCGNISSWSRHRLRRVIW